MLFQISEPVALHIYHEIYELGHTRYAFPVTIPSILEAVRTQSPNPAFQDASVRRFNQGIGADADMSRRVRHLVLR